MASIDITGKTYGLLTAKKYTGEKTPDGIEKWLFHCACGKQVILRKDNVTTGKTTSCGCEKKLKRMQKLEQEKGKHYGNVTVVRYAGYSAKSEGPVFEFECDHCGCHFFAPIKTIRNGHRKSCGCISRVSNDNPRYKDLIKRKFGRLTLMSILEDKRYRKGAIGHFRCDCGKEVDKPLYFVQAGGIQSCGCLSNEINLQNYQKLRMNYVCGTNLGKIRQAEESVQKNSTTKIKGVCYNKARNCFEAYIYFNKKKYLVRCNTEEEARRARASMRRIHTDFLDWWNNLSQAEKDFVSKGYPDMRSAQSALLKERLDTGLRTDDAPNPSTDSIPTQK